MRIKRINLAVQNNQPMPPFTYILPAAIAICWSVCIFCRKDTGKIQTMLAASMLTAASAMIFNNISISTFVFPFIFLAVRSKTSPKGLSKWDCLIFIPSILLIPFATADIIKIYFYLQVVAISIWAWICIHRYNKLMAEFYDASGEMSADNLGQVLLYSVSSIVVLNVALILPEEIKSSSWFPYIPAIFISVLQFLVGYNILQIKEAAKLEKEAAEIIAENGSEAGEYLPDLEESETSTPTDKLLKRVIDEQLYLDPNLSLVSLAETFNTNRTYLSRSIHNCYNQNFSEFINSLRIKYSIELMKEQGDKLSIKEIAMQSGYGNLQSFYRNFSEIMQMTPKQWLSK